MKQVVLWLLYSVIGRTLLVILIGVRFANRGVLKSTEQYVVVANHNSHLDTVSIMSAMPSKRLIDIMPIAAADYFGDTKWRARLTRFFVNALLIPRSRPKSPEDGPDPIALLIEAIDAGKSLIVFPEGTRGKPDQMQRFKRGIGLVLTERPQVAVIPAFFKGIGRVLPKGELIPVPFNTVLQFGEPFYVQAKGPEAIALEIEQKVSFIKSQMED